jgi:alkanesulfonate monooxygenase SsuD/methylene tetrahydromethanopterin reductase-like flavin-dependent oxidoreductase (luciferase family)
MHFGSFMEFNPREGGSETEAFREGFALVDASEAWGLDCVWLAEFHFNRTRSVLSSPIVTATAIAARTRRLRVGLAVYVLPLTNPLRVAEEVSTLDQISGGRVEFGIGRSGFVGSYNSYTIPYAESETRFDEALEILRRAWAGGRFSYDGRYYHVANAEVVPQPVQRPYPPMRMAATSAATFEKVARLGLPLFVGLRGDGMDELRRSLERYREAWAECGHAGPPSAYLRVPVFAGKTAREAYEAPREGIVYYFRRQAELLARQGAGGGSRAELAAGLNALTYDNILDSRVAFGDSGGLIDRFRHWQDELGIDGIVAELNAGGMLSEAQVLDSLKVLTHEVMPAFK